MILKILIKKNSFNQIDNQLKRAEFVLAKIINFYSKPQLSDSLFNDVIKSFSEIFIACIEAIKQIIYDSIGSLDLSFLSFVEPIVKKISKFEKLFDFISTSYKQTKVIESFEDYIKPEEILLGIRDETVLKKGVIQLIKKGKHISLLVLKKLWKP